MFKAELVCPTCGKTTIITADSPSRLIFLAVVTSRWVCEYDGGVEEDDPELRVVRAPRLDVFGCPVHEPRSDASGCVLPGQLSNPTTILEQVGERWRLFKGLIPFWGSDTSDAAE
jgi:hypothetical protein